MPEHSISKNLEPARIEFLNVSAGYNALPAIQDISFLIPYGAKVAVLGPNGAGKSTLFKTLVGLIPIISGKVSIHNKPVRNHLDCVAYIPQREEVDWHFPVTALDVVTMGRYGKLGWLQFPGRKDRDIALESLKRMGIAHLAHRPILELSGGEQQRVFLARAIAQEPHILLLDEPFTGVDITTQETTTTLLNQFHEEKVTLMVSTHDLNLARQHFQLVILMNHRLIAFGTPEEVFTSQNIETAFGKKVFHIPGETILVDECCPPPDQEV